MPAPAEAVVLDPWNPTRAEAEVQVAAAEAAVVAGAAARLGVLVETKDVPVAPADLVAAAAVEAAEQRCAAAIDEMTRRHAVALAKVRDGCDVQRKRD